MRQILLVAALLCATFNYAQIEFEKGFFINNSGKRIECYIENRDWNKNPSSFNYKLSASDADVKTENILGVSAFGIDNKRLYKRFSVDVERSSTVTAQLQRSKSPSYKNETLFLEAVVTGKANLYTLNDSNILKFFYQVDEKPIEQLIMIRYLNDDYFEQNNQFRQQLYNDVRCEKTPDQDFKYLEYSTKALAAHFNAYNACFASDARTTEDFTTKDQDRDVFVLRILPGIYQAEVTVDDPSKFYNVSTDFTGTIVNFSLDLEYIFPFGRGAWSMFANPGYQKFESKTSFTRASVGFNGDNPISYNASIEYASLNFPLGLKRYFSLNKSSKLFVSAAVVVNMTMTSDPKVTFTNADNLPNGTKALPISARNNFTIGFGYCFNRLSAELRYNSPRELSNYLSWRSKYSSYGLNLGYKLF